MRSELEAALLQHRDDVKRWAVYADWLEAAGDPHGALASLMLRREAKPSRALSEALAAQAPLIATLTPESLKTLATRGFPRLVPVFRRGFLFSAGAEQASDFEALVHHRSAALLDHAILEAGTETLEEWLSTVKGPLPWRRLELTANDGDEPLDVGPWLERLPYLEELSVSVESGQVEFGPSATLRRVRIREARPPNLASLFGARLPSLTALELVADEDWQLDPLASELQAGWPKLTEVLVEGRVEGETRRLCARRDGPRQVVVRAGEGSLDDFAIRLQRELETSFVVLHGELTPEREQAITQFALLGGVTRLVAFVGAAQGLTLIRLHGTGDAPLVPRVALQQLVKKDRSLNGVALTLSSSNDAASAWSFGPHVARADERRNVLPLSRRDDAYHSRDQLTREVLDALLGYDPGLDVLEALLLATDAARPRALVGGLPAPGERVPLFTDHEAQPEVDETDEYDDEEGEDALDGHGEDDDDARYDDWDTEEADPWGGAPVNVPDYGPPEPVAAAPADEAIVEDDPEDDLDPPLHDAFTADEEEVWTEGPVDLPEHHAQLPGDPIVTEPEPDPQGSVDPALLPCARCHQPAETARCARCQEELCRSCAGPQALIAWEEGLSFSCSQCVPEAEGKFVRPNRARPLPNPLPVGERES
ncbi:MAG: hypothetical protein Q8L48_18915 [Archangium sp.]|nr:hypothetical protein [Archangium sp.]